MSESTKTNSFRAMGCLKPFARDSAAKLITPQDAAYDETRKVYNGMIDRHPALIARCADVTDVIASIHFAREHQLRLAVRVADITAAAWVPVTMDWCSIFP